MKKFALFSVLLSLSVAMLNAQGKTWRYRGDVRASIGTEFIISPYTWTVSTSHGAMYSERLFIGVDFGFKMNELPVIPAYAYVEGRFPFRSNERNSFVLGCGIGAHYRLIYPAASFVVKVPFGFEFRLRDDRCAIVTMIDLIPLSLANVTDYNMGGDGVLAGKERIGWNKPDIGLNFTLGFRF